MKNKILYYTLQVIFFFTTYFLCKAYINNFWGGVCFVLLVQLFYKSINRIDYKKIFKNG